MSRVLVTGASSGIGKEMACVCAEKGRDLVITSRNEARLEALAASLREEFGITVDVIAMDLSQAGAPLKLVNELQRRDIEVNWLINNAGFGLVGASDTLPLDRQLEMVQLNVSSLVELTQRLLPQLKKQPDAGILNVASVAAFGAGPNMAVYYATKAFVLSFSEALHHELKNAVNVSCLCPGITETGFQQAANFAGIRLEKFGTMDARKVAEQGILGLEKNKAIVVPGAINSLFVSLAKLSPRFATRSITGWLQSS